jgi:hypothetical protein
LVDASVSTSETGRSRLHHRPGEPGEVPTVGQSRCVKCRYVYAVSTVVMGEVGQLNREGSGSARENERLPRDARFCTARFLYSE